MLRPLFPPLSRRVGGYLRNADPDTLLGAVYRQALLDLKPFVQDGRVLESWQTASAESRARALSAALFLAEEIPAARHVVRRLLRSFRSEDEAEELLLTTRFGAYPWRESLSPVCYRCGRSGGEVWRQVFSPPDTLPAAYRWRYDIPENHVPLCRTCAAYAWSEDPDVRVLWGRAVWGVRFDAWERLHLAFARGEFPRWDRGASPLWPPAFGGEDWASGKGVLLLRYPRPYSVKRLAVHRDAARVLLDMFPLVRHSLRARSFLLRVAALKGRKAPSPSARLRHA